MSLPRCTGAPVVILAAIYAGPADEREGVLKAVREMGRPIADLSVRQPYVRMQSDLDPLFADGQLYYWKSLFADSLGDEVIDVVVDLVDAAGLNLPRRRPPESPAGAG